MDVVESENLNGPKKFFPRREKSIKGYCYSLRGSTIRFYLRQNNGWEGPLVPTEFCGPAHLHTFTLHHWSLGLTCITWSSCHLACDNLLERQLLCLCPAIFVETKGFELKPRLHIRDSAAHKLSIRVGPSTEPGPTLGPTIFFRLCKSLSISLFLHLVLPSEKA